MMTQGLRIFLGMISCVFLYLLTPYAHAQSSLLGKEITNIATIEYSQNNNRIKEMAGPASFIVEARRTPSVIKFHRVVENAPDRQRVTLNGSDYSPSGNLEGPFLPIELSENILRRLTGGKSSRLNKGETLSASIVDAVSYQAGDVVIISVEDQGQNGNPKVIEQISASVQVEEDDKITIQLYESSPDSGKFFAYIPTTAEKTEVFDEQLSITAEEEIDAQYSDRFDAEEVSTTSALLNAFGVVIDSVTSEPLDNVKITLIDDITGQPALVFGNNGIDIYPSTVTSGQAVEDEGGDRFSPSKGQFTFPIVLPGRYRFEIVPPVGYSFPSLVMNIPQMGNASAKIDQASYGEVFEVENTGPVMRALPLDTSSDLVLRKQTQTSIASIGDFVSYTINVENRGDQNAPLKIRDIAPEGFRLVKGSVSIDQGIVSSESINGREYDFLVSPLAAGQSAILSYTMEVGAGAQNGESLNTAFVINASEEKISNSAESIVFIQEELLRSRGTIIGLVSEAQCGMNAEADTIGVPGVRLYMETGAYVVSDKRGMFHFENVKSGTHVVQIDEVSLPDGYEAQTCDGKPIDLSEFVDLTGGTIWRAEFELRKIKDFKADQVAQASDLGAQPEYLRFDQAWLDTQSAAVSWAYPNPSRTPDSTSINIGIKHDINQSVNLSLNGNSVPSENRSSGVKSSSNAVSLSRWRSVDIEEGENVFVATILDAQGEIISSLEKRIWYVTNALRAAYEPEESNLIADGRTVPEIAVRITNGAGRSVHAGRIIGIDVETPYQLQLANNLERQAGVSQSLAARGGVVIDRTGLAKIKLEPTLNTGYVTINIKMDDDRIEVIRAYLAPEKRDWLVVGMAEGKAGSRSSRDSAKKNPFEDVFGNGRIAVYAKGNVLTDWLLTIGIDTDRERTDNSENGFVQEVNPNAGYLLYGDGSYQQIDAQSRYPVFVKLEKDGVQALFGDFNTDLNTTQLSRYSRRLSGLKFVANTKRFLINMFASETNQGFNKDELVADGTSGPYQLSASPILEQSETVTIEVRDRLRPDEILDTRNLIRFLDYELNSRTGELIFRQPVDVTDTELNPQVIVIDYETTLGTERNVTFGGRGAVKLKGDKVELGASFISENGNAGRANAESILYGVDARIEPIEGVRVRAEYAQSDTKTETGSVDGYAALVEGEYQGEKTSINGYFRRENTGFGIGQQTSATENIQRFGLRASHQLAQSDNADTLDRQTTMIEGEAYREESLTTGRARDVFETMVKRRASTLSLDMGLKYVKEALVNASARKSVLLVAGAQKTFKSIKTTFFARREQPIFDNSEDQSSLFPERTLLGIDKTITEKITLNVRHEILGGGSASGENTRFGVTYRPWTGADIRTSFDYVDSGNLRRLGATIGVDQTILLSDAWSMSVGGARRAFINGSDGIEAIVPDSVNSPLQAVPASNLTGTEGYASYYFGLQRLTDFMTASARVEYRDGANEERYSLQIAAARQVQDDLSFAGSGRFERQTEKSTGKTSNRGDVRLGFAYRPRENAPVIYDRLDYKFDRRLDGTKTQKLINNFALNADITESLQASMFLGTKFAQTTTPNGTFESWTHLIGGEQRYQLSEKLDVGVSGSLLYADGPGTWDYSFGPNVGYSPNDDIWISAGWNISGFNDEDFEAAEFSRQGPYITLRAKFDQNTMRDLFDRVSR